MSSENNRESDDRYAANVDHHGRHRRHSRHEEDAVGQTWMSHRHDDSRTQRSSGHHGHHSYSDRHAAGSSRQDYSGWYEYEYEQPYSHNHRQHHPYSYDPGYWGERNYWDGGSPTSPSPHRAPHHTFPPYWHEPAYSETPPSPQYRTSHGSFPQQSQREYDIAPPRSNSQQRHYEYNGLRPPTPRELPNEAEGSFAEPFTSPPDAPVPSYHRSQSSRTSSISRPVSEVKVKAEQPENTPDNKQYIWEVHPTIDIICGRGVPNNSNSGNVVFKELVQQYQVDYIACKRVEKPQIATKIMEIVRNRGGRFLRRVKVDQNGRRFAWLEVVDQRVYEKVCQALRDGAPQIRQQMIDMSRKRDRPDKENSVNSNPMVDQPPADLHHKNPRRSLSFLANADVGDT